MDKKVEQELESLKLSIKQMGDRLEKLEQIVSITVATATTRDAPPAKAASVTMTASAIEEPAVAPEMTAPLFEVPVGDQRPASLSSASDERDTSSKGPSQSIETRIGLYWLNRIGVASLVVGFALLILYSFQYFGPAAKLGIGVALSAGLIALGEWLSFRRGLSWYGQGLIGGGWSLAYFTVYAMHFIKSVRVIESPVVDAVLLLTVAACATVHAVHRKAEIIALLAVVLGFLTVALGQVQPLSPVASAVLAVTAAGLSAHMQWQRLYLWGLVAAFVTGIVVDPGTQAGRGSVELLMQRLAHFGVLWLAFTSSLFFFKGDNRSRNTRLIVGTLIAACGFFFAMQTPLEELLKGHRYLFPLALGCIYAGSYPGLKHRGLNSVSTTHLVIGLTLLSAAVPIAIVSDWAVCVWAMEVAALVYLGLQFGIEGMRRFAMGLALVSGFGMIFANPSDTVNVLGMLIPATCLITFTGAISFGLAAAFHKSRRFAQQQSIGELRYSYYLYFLGAALFAWLIPVYAFYYRVGNEPWMPESTANGLLQLWWTLEAAATVMIGVLAPSRFARMVGIIGLVVAGWTMILTSGDWTWIGSTIIAACLYGLSYVYRRFRDLLGNEAVLGNWFAVGATVVVTYCIGSLSTPGWVSPAWTLEGLLLLLAGFRLRDRWFRIAGLLLFALVMLKLLFVDLSGADTIQRILSFIGAGIVLLGASYAYAKYAPRLGVGDKDESKAD